MIQIYVRGVMLVIKTVTELMFLYESTEKTPTDLKSVEPSPTFEPSPNCINKPVLEPRTLLC